MGKPSTLAQDPNGKAELAFRFDALYDKICREDFLRHAYGLAAAHAVHSQAPPSSCWNQSSRRTSRTMPMDIAPLVGRWTRSRKCTGSMPGLAEITPAKRLRGVLQTSRGGRKQADQKRNEG